jgi:hypothetical protein
LCMQCGGSKTSPVLTFNTVIFSALWDCIWHLLSTPLPNHTFTLTYKPCFIFLSLSLLLVVGGDFVFWMWQFLICVFHIFIITVVLCMLCGGIKRLLVLTFNTVIFSSHSDCIWHSPSTPSSITHSLL